MNPNVYHRDDVAMLLKKRILESDVLSSHEGLFITGIRRIGKTTFLQQDLIPRIQESHAVVIYVDLWADRESPARTVLSAVRSRLRDLLFPGRLKELNIDLKVLSLSFEPETIGLEGGVSLADALLELISKLDRNIVLIIDEIQETLKTDSGRNLLSALKAARDAVNLRRENPNGTYLTIVGTGSHRSFVTAMASRSSQPFYGADRIDFPMLGEEYIAWQIDRIPDKGRLPSFSTLKKGFELLGCRPKVFARMLREIQNYTGSEIDPAFLAICRNQARTDAEEFLKPIQNADVLMRRIFSEIASAGPEGCRNLFSSPFLKELSRATGRSRPITASAVQSKINQMQKNDWIFLAGYGCYAVSDPQGRRVWLENIEEYLG